MGVTRLDCKEGRSFVGRSFLFLEEVDSTNSFCLRRPELLGEPGLVVRARCQTRGRGSKGRSWCQGDGDHLFCSAVVHGEVVVADGTRLTLPRPLSRLTLLCGVALHDALAGLGVEGHRLKWANDLLIGGRKVAGILCELAQVDGREVVVVGVGVNCSGGREQFPKEIRSQVTTLAEQGFDLGPDQVLHALVDQLDRRLRMAAESGYGPIYRAWNRRCFSLGGRVVVSQGQGWVEGDLQGLDQEGRLVVVTHGSKIALEWGTLRYVR